MVPPILMAGLRLASHKTKMSDRTLTGATLEMEIFSQSGQSTLRDFRPSCLNHGKRSVVGLTVSEIGNILDRRSRWWIYGDGGVHKLGKRTPNRSRRQRCRGMLSGGMIQGTTMKQKAYDNWSPLSCTRKR